MSTWWWSVRTFGLLDLNGLDVGVVVVTVEDVAVVGLVTYCRTMLPLAAGCTQSKNTVTQTARCKDTATLNANCTDYRHICIHIHCQLHSAEKVSFLKIEKFVL